MKRKAWVGALSLLAVVILLLDLILKMREVDVAWLFPIGLLAFAVSVYLRYQNRKNKDSE